MLRRLKAALESWLQEQIRKAIASDVIDLGSAIGRVSQKADAQIVAVQACALRTDVAPLAQSVARLETLIEPKAARLQAKRPKQVGWDEVERENDQDEFKE